MVSLDGVIPELRLRTEGLLADGNGVFSVSSAFRTPQEQQELYDLFLKDKGEPANKPGTSKHETGEAVDIRCSPIYNSKRAALAVKWGLCVPHREEPWHMELDPNRKPLNTPQEVAKMLEHPAVKIVPTLSGNGYYIVTSDGGVYSFGDAEFFGSEGGQQLSAPICDAALTPSGRGYWLLGQDGGVFAFGDAKFLQTPDGKSGVDFVK